MPPATKEISTPAKGTEIASEEKFYHIGLLPARGKVLFPVMEKGNREHSLVEVDAWTLFSAPDSYPPLEKGMKLFVCEARHYAELAVGINRTENVTFPSLNQWAEHGKDDTNRSNYVGEVVRLNGQKLKQLVAACYRYAIRFPNGLGTADNPTSPSHIIDFSFGTRPMEFTEDQWMQYKIHHAVPEAPTFNPSTDRYFADFVYIRPLDETVSPEDENDYAMDPKRFHSQWIGQVQRSFFKNPPKPVSKAYPREA